MNTSKQTTQRGDKMTRYQVQEKLAYSFAGKVVAKVIRKLSAKHRAYRLHWIQQELAEIGIR